MFEVPKFRRIDTEETIEEKLRYINKAHAITAIHNQERVSEEYGPYSTLPLIGRYLRVPAGETRNSSRLAWELAATQRKYFSTKQRIIGEEDAVTAHSLIEIEAGINRDTDTILGHLIIHDRTLHNPQPREFIFESDVYADGLVGFRSAQQVAAEGLYKAIVSREIHSLDQANTQERAVQ